MSTDLIRFISGTLLEHDQTVSVSLADAWLYYCGSEPGFDPQGTNVIGIHAPGRNDDERQLLVSRAANPEAVRHAIELLKLKWSLERVSQVSRLSQREMGDWMPDLEERPYDLGAVRVWPEEPEHPVRDSIVLEVADNPGHYIHRARHDRRAIWTVPAKRVSEALCLPFPEAAESWIRANASEDGPLNMRWRSTALADEDQRNADRQREEAV